MLDTYPLDESMFPREDSDKCPYETCEGTLIALDIPGDAFRKRVDGMAPIATSKCLTCKKEFAHIDVLRERVLSFARARNIDTSQEAIDDYRCQPPSENFEQSPREQILFALILLDYQFHHATHTG